MSDKKGHYDESTNLLKKKTTRKKKQSPKLEKDFDIKKFRDKIFNELAADGYEIQRPQDIQSPYELSNEYDRKYKEYLQEGFSYNTLMFVNRIILESTTLPVSLRTNFALHKILLGIVKALMMNELEIVYLSLYLDKMGWTTDGYQLDENLLITGISVKMYLNQNYGYIIEHLSSKQNKLEDRFNAWLSIKKDYYNAMTIAPRELNERFKLLSKPFDTYCKQNYIDYNFIVDQILQMSLPYSEGKQNQERMGTMSLEQTLYEPSVHIIKQPEGGYVFPVKEQNMMGGGQNINMNNINNLGNNAGIGNNLGSNMSNFKNMKNYELENLYNYSSDPLAAFMQKQQGDNISKPVLDSNIMNSNPGNQMPMNLGNSINLGRIDSLNFLRDGSFYNWESNNDRFLPSRGPSQLFGQFSEDQQDEAKNFFSKTNAFRNVSVQSVVNEQSPPGQAQAQAQVNSIPNSLNLLPSYPSKNFSIENLQTGQQIKTQNNNTPAGDNKGNLVKEEIEDMNTFIENKSMSFGSNNVKVLPQEPQESLDKKSNADGPNVSQFNPSVNKPLLKLEFGGADNTAKNVNVNLFKKLKEEQQK